MIRLLDNGMINKIAAGEVVERPMSVVKELVENAIDAGATSIEVTIQDGGLVYIRVTDNGCGIPKDEVRTAFLRHATSKITAVEDLDSILTMGFRGEALSSIAAVAQVELLTKTAEQASGVRIELSGGEVLSEADVGATVGTSITVRNLFANVPARRKFLKKPATEGGYIAEIINKLALGNPSLAFKYSNNQSTLLQTRGDGDLKTVIYGIYGKEVANSLIKLQYNQSGVKLDGYIGKPSVSRGNRNYSLLYINGRYVKSDIVQSAIEEAYKTKLMQGKFPFCVLRLGIRPETVDVNVHPTKLEVRFSDESLIYKSVFTAVSTALKSEALIPMAVIPDAAVSGAPRRLSDVLYDTPIPSGIPVGGAITLAENVDYPASDPAPLVRQPLTQNIPPVKQPMKEPRQDTRPEPLQQTLANPAPTGAFFTAYRIIGQVFNTYWLIEQGASVYLIDQHAAHERVLYEKLITTLKSGKTESQRLVQPVMIPVSQTERQRIMENRRFLDDCGFEIDEFDQGSFVLYAVPFVFGAPTGAGFFVEILDSLGSFENPIENVYDAKLDRIAVISCKAAVKANDRLSNAEARELIEQVLRLNDPFTCPHGRPTIVELSKIQLEKMFKRVQP